MSKLMLKAEVVEGLTREDIEYAFKGVRVHRSAIDSKKLDRKNRFFRNEYVTIKNLETGKWIVRKVQGHSRFYDEQYKKEHNAPFPKNAIALHYDDRDELGLRDLREPVNVVLYRVTQLERLAHYWNQDDNAGARSAVRLGVVVTLLSMKDSIETVEMVAGWLSRLLAFIGI